MKIGVQELSKGGLYSSRGFSLVELLTVVAVLGLMASMSVSLVGGVTSDTKISAAKRKAHNIASVFTAGIYAGAPSFLAATSVDEARNAVGRGDHGGGELSDLFFRLPGVSDKMDDGYTGAEKSSYYLSWENGVLVYNPGGNG